MASISLHEDYLVRAVRPEGEGGSRSESTGQNLSVTQRISLLPAEDGDVFSQTISLLPLNTGPFALGVLDSFPVMLCTRSRSTLTVEPSTGLLKKRVDGDREMDSTRELPLAS